jgi:hypothetical protein
MAQGGFDIIIGNPPYVETSLIPRAERDHYRDHYETARAGFDLYVLFIERALKLIRDGGWFSFITSGKFLNTEYGKRLCEFVLRVSTVADLIDLSAQKHVFGEAINYPVIIVCRKGVSPRAFRFAAVPSGLTIAALPALNAAIEEFGYDCDQVRLAGGAWPPLRGAAERLFAKLASVPWKLGGIADIFHGLQTNADPVFILERVADLDSGLVRVRSRATGQQHDIEPGLLHPVLKGSVHMRRWLPAETSLLLLFPYPPGSSELLSADVLERDCPAAWEYLNLRPCKDLLEARDRGRWRGHPLWYGYARLVNHEKFGTPRPRLLTPSIAARASFSYDPDGRYYFVGSGGGGGGGYGVELKPEVGCSPLFILGLLNSKPLDWYLHRISSPFRGGYRAYNRQYIAQLPIRLPNMSDATDKERHDGLVALVERMLALHERLAAKGGVQDEERAAIVREIERTDREIDELVYDLYGLTQEERRLVEEEVRR